MMREHTWVTLSSAKLDFVARKTDDDWSIFRLVCGIECHKDRKKTEKQEKKAGKALKRAFEAFCWASIDGAFELKSFSFIQKFFVCIKKFHSTFAIKMQLVSFVYLTPLGIVKRTSRHLKMKTFLLFLIVCLSQSLTFGAIARQKPKMVTGDWTFKISESIKIDN